MVMVSVLGDDIQAIKAGVMEIAYVFAINKADKDGAKKISLYIEMMLDFKKDWHFRPPVSLAIAETNEGIDKVYKNILKHRSFLEKSNKLNEKRLEINRIKVKELVQKKVSGLVKNLEYTKEVDELLAKTISKEIDPYSISNISFYRLEIQKLNY